MKFYDLYYAFIFAEEARLEDDLSVLINNFKKNREHSDDEFKNIFVAYTKYTYFKDLSNRLTNSLNLSDYTK